MSTHLTPHYRLVPTLTYTFSISFELLFFLTELFCLYLIKGNLLDILTIPIHVTNFLNSINLTLNFLELLKLLGSIDCHV